jgi:hypothetical protein
VRPRKLVAHANFCVTKRKGEALTWSTPPTDFAARPNLLLVLPGMLLAQPAVGIVGHSHPASGFPAIRLRSGQALRRNDRGVVEPLSRG